MGIVRFRRYSSSSISWKRVKQRWKGGGMEREMGEGVLEVIGFFSRWGENWPSN